METELFRHDKRHEFLNTGIYNNKTFKFHTYTVITLNIESFLKSGQTYITQKMPHWLLNANNGS